MDKKKTTKKAAALFLGLALAIGGAGCNFIQTNSEADLNQIVATVNISKALEEDTQYSAYASKVAEIINDGQTVALKTDVPKRDLVSSFLSVGSTYMQYGYTSAQVFEMLINSLVNRKVMVQHAVAYYLSQGLSVEECKAYVAAQKADSSWTEKEQALLTAHPEMLTLKYFLTENGTDNSLYDYTVYTLKKSMNNTIDSSESSYIDVKEDEHEEHESRVTPTNVNTEKTEGNYYPVKDGKLNYDVYTGRNDVGECGEYEKLDGSTKATRQKAYNAFLSNLRAYSLLADDEDATVISELDYYFIELVSQLEQSLINKYYEDLQEDAINNLAGYDQYVTKKYNDIKAAQEYSYTNDSSAFSTALDGVSDDSFVLYGTQGAGFVYNILLPFSASQELAYAAAQNKNMSKNELFNYRKELLSNITAKDLRNYWFSEHENEDYAFEATGDYYKNANILNNIEAGEKNYLFFENNLSNAGENGKYESLTQYLGAYPYNGTVDVLEDGGYKCSPYTIGSIDEFINEMEEYLDYAVTGDVANEVAKQVDGSVWTSTYASNDYNHEYVDKKGKVKNFNDFIYYMGSVEGLASEWKADDYFNAEKNGVKNKSYAALSAINELMFAYSTDTGCLNTYMGYAVTKTTNFVDEFEYAAQIAVKNGVGSYVVCPSDYGWHIIYCSFVYDGEVYEGYNAQEKDVKGTFSNLFYESLKATYTSEVEQEILETYNAEGSVTLYTSRYADLMGL
ncbi:MAG: hypothetical protein IJV85_05775 [Clostridia bacterium]|nr:hypothetical protein [Clostridia bacterium]